MALAASDPPGLYKGRPPRSFSETNVAPHSKRRRARSVFRCWENFCLKHTWVIPLVLLTVILSAYAVNPNDSNPIHQLIFLSYPLPPETPDGPVMYGKGPADMAFVVFYTIVLSFTREFLMQRMIKPLARRCGIKGKAKTSRFMEQFYTAVYFAIFGPYGLYVMSRTKIWYFNTTAMFEGFPHKTHTADFKAYYLLEASYWAQQAIVLVLQLEKPRKDFKELVGHHIVTLALIALSYRFHFTYIGLAVYITHDVSDFFLATSKTLNYLDSAIMGPYFAMFIAIWIYMRHYLNLRIIWAVLTEFRTVGPFELNWETQQYKCWISQYITFALLSALQAINLFWLFLILRIAKRYLLNNIKQDERSDNEEEEEEVEDTPHNDKTNNGSTTVPTILLNGNSPTSVRRRNADKENEVSNGVTNGRATGSTAHSHAESSTPTMNGKKQK
ncbi:Longevity-assurance family protein [Coccidioides posadasii C735 delta SOWgp]|uniref:Longevity-assurance family protein n=1 Tax=Coccidioides posadasii (strain C735) TaxID=222929 RepID=C5PDJ9_COCP7|nr:Longevity-assurance family protein [Coccidioides posadasii C735 delta SOWgp]EER25160.1 Longevity-assurance family protein [Coccidioides posadasii C735 delta SOWgp]|eukprot:XP_003067305.1 Longevity-assurance family protein [Coccidioides posadasii C735 delta SOWgp]